MNGQKKYRHEFSRTLVLEGFVVDLRPKRELLKVEFDERINRFSRRSGLLSAEVFDEAETAALEFAAQFLGVTAGQLKIVYTPEEGWNSFHVASADGGKLPEPAQMEMDISGFI